MVHYSWPSRREYQLPVLSGLLIPSPLAYVPLSRGSLLADLPEIAIPLGVSLGLAAYSARLLHADYKVDRIKQIAAFGWASALIASAGTWWFVQELQRELAVTILLDEALTVVSIASGIGVFVGTHIVHERAYGRHRSQTRHHRTSRDHLLGETVWTTEPEPDPIRSAITTQIAELEDVDPTELGPLYEDIDPDVFSELRKHDGSQWQLLFYRDEYEIRVSNQGTVTIYEPGDHERATRPNPLTGAT